MWWRGIRLRRQFKFGPGDLAGLPACDTGEYFQASGTFTCRAGNVLACFHPLSVFKTPSVHALSPIRVKSIFNLFGAAITSYTILNGPVAGTPPSAFLIRPLLLTAAGILNGSTGLGGRPPARHLSSVPFASGRTLIGSGIVLAIDHLSASAAIASLIPGAFCNALLTLSYVDFPLLAALKRVLVIDVLVLALLDTLRVIAGHLATGVPFSFWLSSFAFFLFLSLAFGKRAADLIQHRQDNQKRCRDAGT